MKLVLTPAQAKLFGLGVTKSKRGEPRPARTKAERDALPENQVERACLDFLKAHRWNVTRNHVGIFVPYHQFKNKEQLGGRHPRVVTIGEEFMPDWRAERPVPNLRGQVQQFDLEVKGKGKGLSDGQMDYQRRRRAQGYLCIAVDSVEMLIDWHKRIWGQ